MCRRERFVFMCMVVVSVLGYIIVGQPNAWAQVVDDPNVPGQGQESACVQWSQPPIEIDADDELPPVYLGWDEAARSTQSGDAQRLWRMDADDFRCLGSIPITRIRWWGGYKGWGSADPPEPQPEAWHIGFWANQVEGLEPNELHLERLVWAVEVPNDRIQCESVGQGQFPGWFPEMCFVCDLQLEPQEWFYQGDFRTNDRVFWISITAIYPADIEQINLWGWKTRSHVWRDGAVMPAIMGDWPTSDERLFPGRIYPIQRDSLCGYAQPYDLCFELLTERSSVAWDQPFTSLRNWPYYADYMSVTLASDEGDLVPFNQVADDWIYESSDPVSTVSWQGSYLDYGYDPCLCDDVMEPHRPDAFLLSIWADTGPDDLGLTHHPGQKVWEFWAWEYDEILVGYDEDPAGEPNEPVLRYTVSLPKESWFQREASETVYWFGVTAVFEDLAAEVPYHWGWTNSPHTFGSAALAIDYRMATRPRWREQLDPELAPVDMSFTFFTTAETPAGDGGE